MPPDPPKAFLVSQSASNLLCRKKLRLKKHWKLWSLLLKFLATPLYKGKSNKSKQWAVINDLLRKTTNQNDAIHKMLHDKQMTKNEYEISNILNDYFVNIGPNWSVKINNQSMSSISNHVA